ncbi:uncharacterized protein LOC142543694 [Primulina tabacum]|uniref:uncharacterized protein LOC142543694 n=1 Tax=Primulina tabacum TaxID=48773 RepID=UPI003F598B83
MHSVAVLPPPTRYSALPVVWIEAMDDAATKKNYVSISRTKIKVAGLNSESINPGYCCKRCAKKRKTSCLPQEIVFKILLHFPAQIVHDVMRHVCKEWNFMIRSKSFIYDHLRNSTRGVILENWNEPRHGIYVEMQRGCLEIRRFETGFEHVVGSSCNGLVLGVGFLDRPILFVMNPLTKQRAILPSLVMKGYHRDFSLAFVEASMKYKVVHTHGKTPHGVKTQIAVLTIRVDKVWRHIDIQHISLPAREALMSSPLVTGGYMHWICGTYILTMNVETEFIYQFPIPPLPEYSGRYLPMGCNLSFIHKSSRYTRDVWEMNPETGEWTVLFKFDLEPLSYKFKDLRCKDEEAVIPLGWLAGGEVFLFSCLQRICITYNVRTRETQSFELENYHYEPHSQPHVNSLVWLE